MPKLKIKMNEARIKRLEMAREWLDDEKRTLDLWKLKNAYKQRFKVDKITAYKDLACLNVVGAKEKVLQLEEHFRNKSKRKKEKNKQNEIELIDSYDEFCYIVGYTSGGHHMV